MDTKSAVLSVSSLGHYRSNFLTALKEQATDFDLTVESGRRARDASIRVITTGDLIDVWHDSFWIGPFELIRGNWRLQLAADALVLDWAPRMISVWLIVVVRRLMRKPTALWGHAWPRDGSRGLRSVGKRVLALAARNVVTYTFQQRDEVTAWSRNRVRAWAAPNSLYWSRDMGFDCDSDRTDFIYVGRLVREKKVDLLIEAFLSCDWENSETPRLIVVGDGPELHPLQKRFNSSNRVLFYGEIVDQRELKELYARSVAAVSPGYVGLNATQALSFGVPMIYNPDERNSPEVEVLNERNAVAFRGHAGLRPALSETFKKRAYWRSVGPDIVTDCARTYSVEQMAVGMSGALRGLLSCESP